MEYAVTKQFKVEIDVFPNDLPRELAERQVLMEHYEEQRKLLKFKDDVIWKLSQELKKKYDFYQDEFDKETRHEMNEWARLVDRYSAELKKYEMVCAFCGQSLTDQNINSHCIDNTKDADQEAEGAGVYFTEEQPDKQAVGNRRHWFSKPSNRGFKLTGSVFNDAPLAYVDPRIAQMTQRANNFVMSNDHLVPVIRKINELSRGGSDIGAQIRHLDVSSSGFVTKDDFINAVFDTVKGVKPSDLMQLLTAFTEHDEQDVKYEDFLHLIQRNGEVDGLESQYRRMSAEKADGMSYGRPSERQMREVLSRIKSTIGS